jgi:hypothetical protein
MVIIVSERLIDNIGYSVVIRAVIINNKSFAYELKCPGVVLRALIFFAGAKLYCILNLSLAPILYEARLFSG